MATKDTEMTDIVAQSASPQPTILAAGSIAPNREIVFQESALRLVLKVMGVVTLGLLVLLALGAVSNRQVGMPQIVLCAVVLALVLTASFILSRQQFETAARLTVIMFIVAAAGSILIPLIPDDITVGIDLFLFTILLTAVVMPRPTIIPVAMLCLTVLVAALLLTASDFSLQIAIASALLFAGSALLLNRVRTEFDNRFAALDAATREIEKAKQAKEDADAMKYQVIGGISHDLRSPLNAVIGYAEIMLSGMTGALSDKQQELITYMHVNAQKLLGLINDVLNLQHVQNGTVEVAARETTPSAILAPVIEKMKTAAAAKQISLNFTIAPDTPQSVTTDAQLVQDVVRHLIDNAIKFSAQGTVDVNVNADGNNRWCIRVTDNGSGIAADHLEDIFTLFQRLENAKGKKGMGMGLTIVKGFVNQLRGEITAESQVDKGSTFTVYLPINQR